MHAAFIFLTMLMAACAGIDPFAGEKASSAQNSTVQVSSSSPGPVPAPSADMELRLAKLWSRVDELENQQIRQKERMKLLEKGLMLGIIPEELKGDKVQLKNHGARRAEGEEEDAAPSSSAQVAPIAPRSEPVITEKNKDIAEYRRLLQIAQEKFNAANYGQAIVHYNQIGDTFDDSITEGNHHYWIGLSWFYLKEYQLAEQSFRKLIDQYNHNSWVAYSRFYLAKIDLNRGMSGRARDQFKLLIDEYPNQDLGEMARMEIDRMREKL